MRVLFCAIRSRCYCYVVIWKMFSFSMRQIQHTQPRQQEKPEACARSEIHLKIIYIVFLFKTKSYTVYTWFTFRQVHLQFLSSSMYKPLAQTTWATGLAIFFFDSISFVTTSFIWTSIMSGGLFPQNQLMPNNKILAQNQHYILPKFGGVVGP